jgi:hypothetical protein
MDVVNINRLRQLMENPEQLAYERARCHDPPPPYSESAPTTQAPSPTHAVVEDEWRQKDLRERARNKSTPYVQFQNQTKRERERLGRQQSGGSRRKQTLPFDQSSDYRANSENNVRSRWVEQGIWGKEWGPAWSPNSHPMTHGWRMRESEEGPFYGSYNPTTSYNKPGARWGHEESESELDPEPEPESQTEQQPQANTVIFGARPDKLNPPPRLRKYVQTPLKPLLQSVIPRPTVRNPEASRPHNQFQAQLTLERQWIMDEIHHEAPNVDFDLDTMAYESVKRNWRDDGIWNPRWGETPGTMWMHEETEGEEAIESVSSSCPVDEQPFQVSNNKQQTHSPPINDSRHAPVSDHDGAYVLRKRSRRIAKNTSNSRPIATDHVLKPAKVPHKADDSIRKTRRSRVTRTAAQNRGARREPRRSRRLAHQPPEIEVP